jgi:hypothetical protein
MTKKKTPQEKPDVHQELDGLDIKINEFGEIITNYKIEKINDFLNDNLDDKKLRHLESKDTSEEE